MLVGRGASDGGAGALVVGAVDPFRGAGFDVGQAAPGPAGLAQFRLAEAGPGLHEGLVRSVADGAGLVVDALDMTASPGRLEPGCVIHSDRGSECTSRRLRAGRAEVGHRRSPGRTGSLFDSAAAKSFLAVLRGGTRSRFRSDRATARADVFDFAETFCNRRRLRQHVHRGCPTRHARAVNRTGPSRGITGPRPGSWGNFAPPRPRRPPHGRRKITRE